MEEGLAAKARAGDSAGATEATAGTAGAAAEDEGASEAAAGAAAVAGPEVLFEALRSAMDKTRAMGLRRRTATGTTLLQHAGWRHRSRSARLPAATTPGTCQACV